MDSVLKQLKKSSILFISGLFEHVILSGGQVWMVLSENAQSSMRIEGGRRYAITSQKDRSAKNWQRATLQGMSWVKVCTVNYDLMSPWASFVEETKGKKKKKTAWSWIS